MPINASIDTIVNAWRQGRPIVPFVGAGISVAAGYPSIAPLTGYLAKVQFALENGIYRSRYPIISDGIDTADQHYVRRPSEFITDFGWPEFGQLNSDMWSWIATRARPSLVKDHDSAVQSILLARLQHSEPSVADAVTARPHVPKLDGDWSALLGGLSEGQVDLVDALFTGLGKGRAPTRAHLFLAFLTQVLGIRLLLTTNFDSLLESAMHREGLHPKIFDIHRDADLPHARLVRSQLSIIKLAGSAYGLRFGEKIQNALEDDARRKFREYLPDNALVVVLGFSGWERRMMQVIGDFARRQASNSGQTQVLWLTDVPKSGKDSPQLQLLRNDLTGRGRSRALIRQTIRDANSFLPGLFFKITSGFPASQQRYDALVSVPPLPREDEKHKTFPKMSSPGLVVFCDAESDRAIAQGHLPSSWASIAASHCALANRSNRHTLWIDLENHYSVASVVQEILSGIRRIDPEAPRLMLPSEPTPTQAKHDLVKAVERIREALQRGRYLIVFDSLESFGRPHFGHHGLPQRMVARADANGQAQRLFDLISLLIGLVDSDMPEILPPLHDTLVFVAVTNPTTRHSNRRTHRIQRLCKELNAFFNVRLNEWAISRISVRRAVRFRKAVYSRGNSGAFSCTAESENHDRAASEILATFSGLSGDANLTEWVQFAYNVILLRQALRSPQDVDIDEDGRNVLLSLLSFCRRPRPIALTRAVLLRWTFDPGDLDVLGQMTATLQSIDDALSSLEQGSRIELLEDGTVWIPRQLHEPLYAQITSVLQLAKLPSHLTKKHVESCAVMLLSSLLCSTWHLQLARAYFADVYLATHDEQAFFEYMYHRIAAMRYLVLAQSALSNAALGVSRLKRLEVSLESEGRMIPLPPTATSDGDDVDNAELVSAIVAKAKFPKVAMLLNAIGTFASVRRDRSLRDSLLLLDDPGREALAPTSAVTAIRLAVMHSRLHSLKTLGNAFTREHDRISATTTPHTWLGWINQLLDAELPEVACEWSTLRDIKRVVRRFPNVHMTAAPSATPDFHAARRTLGYTLLELKLRLLRQKLDYTLARTTAARQIGQLSNLSYAVEVHLTTCSSDLLLDTLNDAWSCSDVIETPETQADCAMWRHLLRCWIEFARALEGQVYFTRVREDSANVCYAADVLQRVIKHIEQRLRVPHAQELLYEARRALADVRLHHFPMWCACDVVFPSQRRRNDEFLLQTIERMTHELEDAIRVSAPSAVAYAIHRSDVYSMRARALYLRGNFREAHRVLSLSLNDVRNHPEDSRFMRAIVHLYRAELHTISADVHLPDNGNPMSSMRKLETALECLEMAAQSLEPAAHQAIWWLRIHLGRAQVRHEQILMTVRQLSGTDVPTDLGYAQRSLWLEECVLDGLRSLRFALDTLPFNGKSYQTAKIEPDSLVSVEEKLLALWLQIFVASFACNHLMLARLQMPRLVPPQPLLTGWSEYLSWTASAVEELKDNRVNPLCDLFSASGFWRLKWGPWCEMRQFYYFSKAMKTLVDNETGMIAIRIRDVGSPAQLRTRDFPYGFREELLSIESQLIFDSDVLPQLWNWRRLECEAPY